MLWKELQDGLKPFATATEEKLVEQGKDLARFPDFTSITGTEGQPSDENYSVGSGKDETALAAMRKMVELVHAYLSCVKALCEAPIHDVSKAEEQGE